MSKRANPMAIKAALSYTVEAAATALGKTPATIRNWIKDGLPVMARQKPMLISGSDLRDYLRSKYQAAKWPLKPEELHCLVCRAGRTPVDSTVAAFSVSQTTTLLKGECGQCGATATRFISAAKSPEFAKTFHFKEAERSAP